MYSSIEPHLTRYSKHREQVGELLENILLCKIDAVAEERFTDYIVSEACLAG